MPGGCEGDKPLGRGANGHPARSRYRWGRWDRATATRMPASGPVTGMIAMVPAGSPGGPFYSPKVSRMLSQFWARSQDPMATRTAPAIRSIEA